METTSETFPVKPKQPNRRSFLGALLGVGSVSVGALLSIPLIRFMLHPILARTTETAWSDVGAAEEFATISAPVKRLVNIEQRDGWRKVISEKSVYVVKDKDGQPRVLSSVCPHLGCAITWNESKGQFFCPCHAGVFAANGSFLSGPPPRAMDDLESRIEGGRLQIRYQYFRQLVATKEAIA